MGEEQLRDIYQQHRTVQDKYTYFLLAVTASAIAFAVQKTDSSIISWSLLPIGLAVLLWCCSFYCGCQNLVWIQVTLFANLALFQLQQGNHPNQPVGLTEVEAAKSGTRDAMDENANKAKNHSIWQYRFLVLGAIFFLLWHILEMVIRTVR
ncbi:hypothetical protein Pan241w_28350 [Gimesia alba]|uniref:MraY-like glycosyltransferase n=1 Tax=Gimesia alba TaxID=2527973 RepID=A0A517RFT7_9PLAN|nr:hypothetical protein [Gimesia alba]QDT42746.1 hypothetical protein Pan241w_28350 [Gimesia alba]